MIEFNQEPTIFDDETVFLESYRPDELLHREKQLEEYQNALAPVAHGFPPRNVFLHGPSGVGKTLATKLILNELQDAVDQSHDCSLTTIKVPCRNYSTSYQLGIGIVNTLRSRRGEQTIAETGHASHVVYSKLHEELNLLEGIVLIVLDDLHKFDSNDDDLLYELPRAREQGNVDNCYPRLIGISNNQQVVDSLSPEAEDTLSKDEIHFPKYNSDELREILDHRAQIGFKDGVLETGVVAKCASIAVNKSGSARKGLDLLRKAGDIARDQDAEQVTLEHVDQAEEELDRSARIEGIAELDRDSQILLCSVINLSIEEEPPIRSEDLCERYERIADKLGHRPLSKRRLKGRLNQLTKSGILSVDTVNNTGRYHTYELNVDLKITLDGLEQGSDDIQSAVEKCREKADERGLIL